ncbi:hypothetical protein GBA52_027747 [Prunus armeniaca]|nr:hypothetical protein GBA52_027747 [Prunus armeniaca]
MYMDHRDNLDDVLNSYTDSNVYCRYSSHLPELDKAIVLHDGLDEATSNEAHRTRKLTLSMNSATAKGKENVAAIDEGCVQHEPNKGNSNGKEKVAKVDEGKIETKRKQKLQAPSAAYSSNPTGVRKRTKCSNTRCSNYASVQE